MFPCLQRASNVHHMLPAVNEKKIIKTQIPSHIRALKVSVKIVPIDITASFEPECLQCLTLNIYNVLWYNFMTALYLCYQKLRRDLSKSIENIY